MLLIGSFVLCVIGWAVFGVLSNGDRKRPYLPFFRQPEPNYLKAWRERPSTQRERLFAVLSFLCLIAMMGLVFFAQNTMCTADPTKCRGGKAERGETLSPPATGGSGGASR